MGADGGQIDDVPTALGPHYGKGGADAVEHTADVHVDHPVPFVDLVLGQGGQWHDTGVVDHDVHPAVGVCGVGDEALDVSGVGDIQPAKRRGSAAVPLFDGENCYS